MDISKIDKQTLDLMEKAFSTVLNQNKVRYKKIAIAEEKDQFVFLYEGKDEKVHIFRWSKASSQGVSIGVLAQSVLMPIIPHLRLLS